MLVIRQVHQEACHGVPRVQGEGRGKGEGEGRCGDTGTHPVLQQSDTSTSGARDYKSCCMPTAKQHIIRALNLG